jgi:hypothetical protein
MLSARARGLDTCPQVSFARLHSLISSHLGMAAEEVTACGMSMGFADASASVNQVKMPRQHVSDFVRLAEAAPARGRTRPARAKPAADEAGFEAGFAEAAPAAVTPAGP